MSSTGNEGEERLWSKEELRARAKEEDRRNRFKRASSPQRTRGAANQSAAEEEHSEEDLLKEGGKKVEWKRQKGSVEARIVLGPEGEFQLVFSSATERLRPEKGKGARFKGLRRWAVSFQGGSSLDDLRRVLNKPSWGLWDQEKGEPSLAFKAAEQLVSCSIEINRGNLRALLIRRLHEKAKHEGISSVELDEVTENTPCAYPKPELDTLREQLAGANKELARTEEQLHTTRYQLVTAHDAIFLATEALFKGDWKKIEKAFDLLQRDQWPEDIKRLRVHAVDLAGDLQRPPTKIELRKRYDPKERMDPSQFAKLLKRAGLSWLRRAG
jgi:hypothetical protein